jgi:predicted DNA-binding transcriptional regulator YafY
VLSRCIEKRIKVRVRYQRFDGVTKEYTLHPYHLAWHHGQWYLLAFHERREDFAPFAVSRILRCHEKGGAFDRTDRFNPESFHEGSFGVSGGKAFTVRLRFTPKVAAFIAERVWHPSQTVNQLPSGGVELALKTSAWKPLVRFVLSWLPDVEVISPATLRERVHEKLVEGQGVPNHGCKG